MGPCRCGIEPQRHEDALDLLVDAPSTGCSIASADVDSVVRAPERPAVAPDDAAVVRLRVDDPYARRRHEDLVDVAAPDGPQPLVAHVGATPRDLRSAAEVRCDERRLRPRAEHEARVVAGSRLVGDELVAERSGDRHLVAAGSHPSEPVFRGRVTLPRQSVGLQRSGGVAREGWLSLKVELLSGRAFCSSTARVER
jgi:hypothetical protein